MLPSSVTINVQSFVTLNLRTRLLVEQQLVKVKLKLKNNTKNTKAKVKLYRVCRICDTCIEKISLSWQQCLDTRFNEERIFPLSEQGLLRLFSIIKLILRVWVRYYKKDDYLVRKGMQNASVTRRTVSHRR